MRAAAAWLLGALARVVSLLYPRHIRGPHARDFARVAAHRYHKERARRPPVLAAIVTMHVLAADTFAAVPVAWKDALLGGGPDALQPGIGARLRGQFNGLGCELKLTVRTAARHPGFALLLVATLAVGIGISTAAFDALERGVLNPLPYEREGDLVLLVMQEQSFEGFYGVPLERYHDWRKRATTVNRIEVFRRTSVTRTRTDGTDVLDAVSVSGGLPGMLGITPVAGRVFVAADADRTAPATVMLSESLWRREYGADRSAIGRTITLGTTPTEIIGIWPDGARLDFHEPPDVIRLLTTGSEYGRGSWIQVLARVAPGRNVREVEAELGSMTPPADGDRRTFRPVVIQPSFLLLGRDFVTGVWLVFAGAVLLLAGALSNTAHLLLERAFSRQQELAVRRAMGASGFRVARLFLLEAILYGVSGLVAGAIIALGLERIVSTYEPRLFAQVAGAGVLGRAFPFAAAAAGAAVLVCSLAPLIRVSRRDVVSDITRSHSRGTAERSRVAQVLVSAQAAFAVLLLSGAALLGLSLQRLLAVDPGMAVHELAELNIALPAARYPSPESRTLYASRARDALLAIPGVTGVTQSGMPILMTSMSNGRPRLEGEPESERANDMLSAINGVPPEYFTVTGMRMLEGRPFTADETRAVVVGHRLAARYSSSVVGRTLYLPNAKEPYRIVGVVRDAALGGIADETPDMPSVYLLDPPGAESFFRFLVRTTGDPADVIRTARARFAEIDPAVPLRSPQTGSDVIRRQTAQHRFVALLLAGLAVVGFILAMSGIYGAVALNVVRRTREVGVRMALGASANRLVRQFVASGLKPVIAGTAVGTVIVLLLAPRAGDLLFQVSPRHPLGSVTGILVVLVTGAFAAFIPSRRISRLDPATTLRD
jgi:putative ABC transport system permease protein